MDLVVRYSRWRAVWSPMIPIFALSIPAANWLIDPSDFQARYSDKWIGTVAIAFGILWFVYALWPSAFRFLANGQDEVRIRGHQMWLGTNESRDLRQVTAIEILRSPLRRPTVAIQLPDGMIVIDTAFQAIGRHVSAERIAKAAFEGSGRPYI